LLSRIWRRLSRAAPHVLGGPFGTTTAQSPFAREVKTASLADVASAHFLLFGHAMPLDVEAGYEARLARRPLRFEELAEELLHSPAFTARFGRLVRSVADDVVETTIEEVSIFLRRSDVLVSGPVLAGHPHEPHVWAALAAHLLPGTTFVDVEGYEPVVIAGSRDLLARHRPTVLIEFNPFGLDANFGQDPRRLLDWLLDYADEVSVIVRDAPPAKCTSALAIIEAWKAANARLSLDGRLHIDLLAKARKARD